MAREYSDRRLNTGFAMLNTSYFCIAAVSVGFQNLLLSQSGFSEEMLARMAMLTSFFGLVVPPLMGQLCDRWQVNRLLYLITAIVAPLSFYGMLNSESLLVMGMWSLLYHICCTNVQTIVGGWVAGLNAQGSHVDFSFTRSFGSLSFALMSVVIGFAVDRFGMECLPLLMLIYGAFLAGSLLLLPPPPPKGAEEKKKARFIPVLKTLVRNRPYVLLLLCMMLYGIPDSVFNTYFAVYFSQMGGSEAALGVAMFVLAIGEVPVMMLYSRLEKKISVLWLMAIAIAGYGVKGLCVSLAPNPVLLTLSLLLQMIALALSVPAMQSFVAKYTPLEYITTTQGISTSISGIGRILASALVGWLVTVTSLQMVFRITTVFAFLGAVIFAVGVCIPMSRAKARA